MKMLYRILVVAFAYAAVVVGAGNATGMEPLFYYTSFGLDGTKGVLLAMLLYGVIGYFVTYVGQQLQVRSHKDAIYLLGGRYVGAFSDYLIILMMLGTGIIMIAGSGALFEQQYGIPHWQGALIMTLLIIITLMMRLRKIILVIGAITPLLIALVGVVVFYSLKNQNGSFVELNDYVVEVGKTLPDTLPNWWIASLNHVFMMTVAGVGMSLVIGGEEENLNVARFGGLLGGLIIGGVLAMGHFSLFAQIKVIAPEVNQLAKMPTLQIMNQYAPALSPLLSIVAFGMIYNTAVSMFYVFIARYVEMETPKSRGFIILVLLLSYGISFVGFVQLLGYFYPIVGYVGIILVGLILYGPIRIRQLKKSGEIDLS